MSSFILHPFLSVIVSLLLFAGCFELGKYFTYKFSLRAIIQSVSILEYQYASVGIVLISLILFPLLAFTDYAKYILTSFCLLLFIFGIKFFFSNKYIISKIHFRRKDIFFYLYLFIILLYLLLALSPLTAADVLDYHSGVALNILRFNQYILLPEWFTGLQAGHGETLISLGFFVGAEQFGSLIQFSALLCISGIILKFADKHKIDFSKYFIILSVLSCPILIFLLSGNKPQIFYSSLLFFAFSLNFAKPKSEKKIFINYLIINILICVCVMGKFSFNLTGALVWIFSTCNMVNKKNFFKLCLVPILTFITIYFPFIYWKYLTLFILFSLRLVGLKARKITAYK